MESIIEKIHQSALKFLEPLTLEETYKRITEEAVRLVNGEDGLIMVREANKMKTIYGSSPAAKVFQARKNGYAYNVYASHKAYVLHKKEYPEEHKEVLDPQIHSVIFIPLNYKKKSFGVLAVRAYANQDFTERELKILELFGSLASLAMRKMQLYNETKKTLDLQNNFISMTAHELRTPLTTMSGYIQLLKRKLSSTKSTESNWIESLYEESNRLVNLIQELLEVNRMSVNKAVYSYSPCSLNNLITDAIHKLNLSYPEIKIKWEKQKEVEIIGDCAKLTLSFFNILENAAKFSSEHSTIQIDIILKPQYAIINVLDQGKGIDPKDLPHIFDRFFKGVNSQHSGMGVGLFFAKNVIEHHHGSICIQSELNKGSKVEIKLPLAKYGNVTSTRF